MGIISSFKQRACCITKWGEIANDTECEQQAMLHYFVWSEDHHKEQRLLHLKRCRMATQITSHCVARCDALQCDLHCNPNLTVHSLRTDRSEIPQATYSMPEMGSVHRTDTQLKSEFEFQHSLLLCTDLVLSIIYMLCFLFNLKTNQMCSFRAITIWILHDQHRMDWS